MAARESESLILRTYSFGEADLIVSFFTRDQGRLRGVAKRARRPKSAYGAGLERLSQVRLSYIQKETRELVTITGCELIRSQFGLVKDYEVGVALDYFVEVAEQLLPPAEPSERIFRLLVAMLDFLHERGVDGLWQSVNYYSLWVVRLSGFLSDLPVSADSRVLAEEMLRTPIAQLKPRQWSRTTAADLRRFLVRAVEDHVERKLITVPLLENL
jgi:DNA repair protein RecO (recombination protein O)